MPDRKLITAPTTAPFAAGEAPAYDAHLGEFVHGAPVATSDGVWELVLDGGLPDSTFAKAFLGRHEGELYLFGSAGETTGAVAGIRRWNRRTAAWDVLASAAAIATKDFNGDPIWGASSFKGKLYIGDRRNGQLRRLDLYPDKTFQALTNTPLVGLEDIFPGPVIDGKLWLGTFGRPANNPPGPSDPAILAFDGSAVTTLKSFNLATDDMGPEGWVSSQTVAYGLYWCTVTNKDSTLTDVWTIDPATGTATRVFRSGAQAIVICAWNGEVWAARRGATANDREILVWRDNTFVSQATYTPGGNQGAPTAIMPYGDRLLILGYKSAFYGYDGIELVEAFPTRANHSIASATYHAGYLWVVTNQPVRVYRRRVGLDTLLRAGMRPQRSAAGLA